MSSSFRNSAVLILHGALLLSKKTHCLQRTRNNMTEDTIFTRQNEVTDGQITSNSRLYEWEQLGEEINGENISDNFGRGVSLSADGLTLAVGGYGHDNEETGLNTGHVEVYHFENGSWIQLGGDIVGEDEYDNFGWIVSLSADGLVLAVGAYGNSKNLLRYMTGHARVYFFDGEEWIQRGRDIEGEARGDYSATTVSLAADGLSIAIGAQFNDGNGSRSGHARVYYFNDDQWIQRGGDIDGEHEDNYSGGSVSLSGNGLTLAVGAGGNDGNGEDSGHVRVFQFEDNQWTQLGRDIDGENAGDKSGVSVSLSTDGFTVAVGAHLNDGNGSESGHARVFYFDDNQWNQRGADIDGENAGDNSGNTVRLSENGMIVAVSASMNRDNGEASGHTRVHYFDETGNKWIQRGGDIDGEIAKAMFGIGLSLSANGLIVAVGAPHVFGGKVSAGSVRVFQLDNLYSSPKENRFFSILSFFGKP